jgi:hypothetical protein
VHLKDGVTLRGSGYDDTRIELDARAKPVYAIDVSDARIEGFAVAYAGTSSVPTVSLKSSLVAISACRIRNSAVSAVTPPTRPPSSWTAYARPHGVALHRCARRAAARSVKP